MATGRWQWRLAAPPAEAWAVLADTARFNEAAGFPKHRIEERVDAEGFVAYFAHARVGPFAVDWEEVPVDWISGRHFRHCRNFLNGPLLSLCAELTLAPDGAGTRADYLLEAVPRGALGRLFVGPFLAVARRTFARLVRDAEAYLAGERAEPFLPPPVRPDGATRARLDAAAAAIEETGNGHGLAARLAGYLLTAPEQDLEHLRPLRLARLWREAPRPVVELCLQAVRSGLLAMDWVLLCPRCRGAKASAPSLDRLPKGAHCTACNIRYDRELYRNVELTFRPAAWLRPIESGEFCLYGPMSTPHVVLQQIVAPGERRDVPLALPPGAYRLRTLNPGGQADVTHAGGGFPELIADGRSVAAGAPAPVGVVRLGNAGARPLALVVESRAWVADALTAHRVTSLQAFRDLFPDEALAAGDTASIERMAILFTDLKASTALYERIGDGPAYGLVRAHFRYLAAVIREHDGAIVKTIGDAVMAAFSDPADAARAALAIQAGVPAFNAGRAAGDGAITLKLGLHQGPVVAVRSNGRLDYFGGTVNLAARLGDMSAGGDIVLSAAMAGDPGVAAAIAGHAPDRLEARLRGFTAPVSVVRLDAAVLARAPGPGARERASGG